jgi:hypothetical protein
MMAWDKTNVVSQRLASISGSGPITANLVERARRRPRITQIRRQSRYLTERPNAASVDDERQ